MTISSVSDTFRHKILIYRIAQNQHMVQIGVSNQYVVVVSQNEPAAGGFKLHRELSYPPVSGPVLRPCHSDAENRPQDAVKSQGP